MTAQFPFVRPRPYPNSFVLVVQLRGGPTRRQQRAFFGALHAEARHHGLVMGHKLGLCVFFGAERLCTNHSRHQMLNWLVDHVEVRAVQVSRLVGFASVFKDGTHDNRLQRAARGTLVQWAAYLGGAL
jgi:hypothetical protein